MATEESIVELEAGVAPVPVRLRRNWARRLLDELVALIAALLLLGAVGLVLLDTAPGHRFIVDRIAQLETASGLRISIGRIDGSVFGVSRLKNVRVADSQGVFLTSPEILLDWSPGAWLYNALHIDRLEAHRVTLLRLPKLKPSAKKGPILPGFDIHIGSLRIDRLELQKGVTGVPRVGQVRGSAEIRAGRAMIDLGAALQGDGDRIALKLDAEPDRDRFDLDVRVRAPANGLVPAMFGSKRPLDLVIDGQGSWTRWRGSAALDMSGRPTARLALGVDKGRYRLAGTLAPGQFLKGKLMRLTTPQIRVEGAATLKDRQLDGQLTLLSPSLRAVTKGVVDLAENRYRDARVGVDLLRPSALFPNMTGKQVRMVWTLDGPLATATYAYRLTSPQIAFDRTGFVDVRAEGRGKFAPWPMRVPLRMTARRTTGIGDIAGGILANLRLEGMLTITPRLVRGDGLNLTSDKLKGKVSLMIDLVNGRFDILVSGGMTRYLIPGLGIVDVKSDLHVVPGKAGKARVVGTGEAWVRRLDNSFFASLTGGLPHLTTNLERTEDGIVHFSNLILTSPKLRLTGAGVRFKDGSFHIEARGRQAQYGPLKLILDGRIERPRLDILFDSPNEAMGIKQMRLLLAPTLAGYDYRASGGSRLGPFTSNGQILLPKNGRATIAIAALEVSGTTASGNLRSDPGGFTGKLTLAGGGMAGDLMFSPAGGNQKIEAHLTANGVHFAGPPALSVQNGRIDGTILLAEGATSVDGVVIARGLQSGAIRLSRLTANAKLVNGRGEVRAAMAGQRGSAFEFVALANVAPERISVSGRGSVDRRPFELASPAVLTSEGDGWRIAPTDVRFAGGRARLSGRTGSRPELNADVSQMPLQLLDMIWPNLDLSGIATGRVQYASAGGSQNGRVDLKVRGLSRAGLVLTSKPIDVGLAAVLAGDKAAMRAVAVSDGKTIGRAQARFAPLGDGPLVASLTNARLFAQLRYAGPADTLWRLSGIEVFDLSGPLAIGADISGSLINPQIRGSLKSDNARIESAVTGMVVDHLASSGRFSGSRLVLDRLSGRTGTNGSI
ncbi:MAG TPA: translocation/assembly module TamB, partial [Sphingomicrobium sp.]|nr:translocation/assembly module TamB [Sphingomicrobium sp.]